MRDHYRILGVPSNACREQIQRAYEDLAMAFYPDPYAGLAQRARARDHLNIIEEAFRVLSNPERRQEYDRWRVGRETPAIRP